MITSNVHSIRTAHTSDMPAHSKLDDKSSVATWDRYKRMSDEFRGFSTATSTQNQYTNLTEEFKKFLKDFNIAEADILPLKTEHIEAWFSQLFESRPMRWESFCKRIAALRNFSRSMGFFQLDHLNYNTLKSKSTFCSYMAGLKRKLDRFPRKKAQALTAELLTYVLNDILHFEPNKYLGMRDTLILSLGFLLGLRAVDISVVNTDQIILTPDIVRPDHSFFDVIVKNGKTTKDQSIRYTVSNSSVDFGVYDVMETFLARTKQLYAQQQLSADALGHKLFTNICQRTLKVSNKRITTATVTKILKSRLSDFFARTNDNLSMDEIDAMVEPYTSHSLKSGNNCSLS